MSYSPWGRKELDTTKRLTHTHTHTHTHLYITILLILKMSDSDSILDTLSIVMRLI